MLRTPMQPSGRKARTIEMGQGWQPANVLIFQQLKHLGLIRVIM